MRNDRGQSIAVEAEAVLLTAEKSLRKLAAKAADQGDYEAVVKIADLAKSLAALGRSSQPVETRPPAVANKSESKVPDRKPKSTPKLNHNDQYPKFFREDDSLVKVAWSKTSKAEYEHRAPTNVIWRLTEALTKASRRTGLITMDNVLPLQAEDGEEVPSYQSYLTLAWLKDSDLIRQHGRKGYSLKSSPNLKNDAKVAFESLTLRQHV